MSKSNRGATVIEFALVAFIFFLILWGIFEFGRAFYVYNSAQHLTRCMAREAVVLNPSWHDAAKQSCLFEAKAGMYTWPFYEITPNRRSDMRDAFVIRYYLRDVVGGFVEQPGDTRYDDQSSVCLLTNSAQCISYVQVYVARPFEELRLLRTWLRRPGTTTEPYAATTMPAEAMGFSP